MLKNKTANRFLSLLLALFLWFYVIAIENPPIEKKISRIPIKFTHTAQLEERGLAIDFGQETTVDITIAGSRSDVLKIDASDIEATADLNGYGKGKNFVPVTVKVPRKVDIVEQKTQLIPINVEKLVSRNLPVTVEFQGFVKADAVSELIGKDIEEVRVSGAASQVKKVAKVAGKLSVDELKRSELKYKVKLAAYDKNNVKIDGVKLDRKNANVTAGLQDVKLVELSVDLKGQPPIEYSIEETEIATTVKIQGFTKDLEKVEKVVSDPIYLDNVTESKDIMLTANLPDGVKIADRENFKISLKVKKLNSKEFNVVSSDVKIKGISSELTAKIENADFLVRIFAKDAVLSKLNDENVKLYADLEGLEIGTHNVKLHAEAVSDGQDMLDGGSANIKIEPSQAVMEIR